MPARQERGAGGAYRISRHRSPGKPNFLGAGPPATAPRLFEAISASDHSRPGRAGGNSGHVRYLAQFGNVDGLLPTVRPPGNCSGHC
jgi:hypothetical protein